MPEPLDLARELGTGDPVREAEWTRLFDHLERNVELVYLRKDAAQKPGEEGDQKEKYVANRDEELVDEIV